MHVVYQNNVSQTQYILHFGIKLHIFKYCGNIFVRGRPLFVAFVCNPCPKIRIYIPKKVYTSICLIFIKTIPNLFLRKLRHHEPGKFLLLTITKKNDFTDLLFFNTVTIVPFGVVILAKSLKAFSFPGVENVLLSSKVTYNQNRKNKIMENFYKKTSH